MEQETLTTKRLVLSPRLTKGMTPEEEKEFTESFKRARRPLKKINDIAQREMEQRFKALTSPKAFEVPNWAQYVAWNSGYYQAMKVVSDLTRYESK